MSPGGTTSAAHDDLAPVPGAGAPRPGTSALDEALQDEIERAGGHLALRESEDVGAALELHLEERGCADGWSPHSRRAHPTGGYTTRQVFEAMAGGVAVAHLDAYGELHRSDGPAHLTYDQRGRLAQAKWIQRARAHRGDGPAELAPRRAAGSRLGFALHGAALSEHMVGPSLEACYLSLRALGLDGEQAMAWVVVDCHLGHLAAVDLREAGADAALARAGAQAGLDEQALAEVAHGRLPISWASAGL